MSRFPSRRSRVAGSAVAVALSMTGMTTGAALAPSTASIAAPTATGASATEQATESFPVAVAAGPGSDRTFELDTDLYLPSGTAPSPAVLLAHGFGASKEALAAEAERLRADGYVVMAYSARGFGASGGEIALDSLDYEVADARALVDVLAERDEVLKDGSDPVVGVVGASYGGALALMLGATDVRIDTVVAGITWNDLGDALVPDAAAAGSDERGVFKQAWAAQLFGAGAAPGSGACGRFTAEVCELYTGLVAGEALDDADRELLARSSPASVLDDLTAPTLLLQGTRDTLFGLDQADANARQLAAAGAPVQVTWFDGGHDAGGAALGADVPGASGDEPDDTADDIDAWLAEYLPAPAAGGDDPLPFTFTVPSSARSFSEVRTAPAYPGATEGMRPASAPDPRDVILQGDPQPIVNPPGGLPVTTTSLPGVGSLDAVAGGLGAALGGTVAGPIAQAASFVSEPLESATVVVGAPTVSFDVSRVDTPPVAPGPPEEAVLFAQLRVVTDGTARGAGGGGVAPVRVPLDADGGQTTVSVQLPTTSWRFEAGDRVEVVVRTTDALYLGSPTGASYLIDAAAPLVLPVVPTSTVAQSAGVPATGTLIGIGVVLLAASALVAGTMWRLRRRSRQDVVGDELAPASVSTPVPMPGDAPPLVIRGLTKDYRSGFRAVDDLSFTVQHGQVLGLLGPNGAGKTTALRMVTGLLRPGAGEIEIFGHRLTPGAPVLSRVGCFIEGPGFLAHLSGRRNLELYWAASGRRPDEARFDEVLAIADLGSAIRRRVGGYSQGMRQRLAIAQAMLGMPELLILDEPTNGLDPPQIHALRGVLRRYAASGRTVIVSSHLLGEVEQTCSHVVVMAQGRLIAAGTVADLAGDATELTIEVTDAEAALSALARLAGVDAHVVAPGSVRVVPGGHAPEDVVAALTAARVGVRSVTRGRHLEETFLAMVGEGGSAR